MEVQTNTRIVHLRKRKFTLYIGRDFAEFERSKWYNPFHIGIDGDRVEVLAKHLSYLRSRPDLLVDLHEIDDEILGCWCRPETCHGDNLILVRKEQLNAGTTT